MKPINALILSLLAGVGTFVAQYHFFPPRLHAATLAVPKGADWRQRMIDQDPGAIGIRHQLAQLTRRLELSPEQVKEFRPLLERQHEKILALLLTAPPTLTRSEFIADERQITDATQRQLDARLSPEQLELAAELHGKSAA